MMHAVWRQRVPAGRPATPLSFSAGAPRGTHDRSLFGRPDCQHAHRAQQSPLTADANLPSRPPSCSCASKSQQRRQHLPLLGRVTASAMELQNCAGKKIKNARPGGLIAYLTLGLLLNCLPGWLGSLSAQFARARAGCGSKVGPRF